MNGSPRVWVVNRAEPTHRIQFPARENAERWLDNHSPDKWRIEPIEEHEQHRKEPRT